jgi:deoxyxylulose-5-phosphate synthase
MDNSPETKLLRLGLPDAFIEHGSVAEQMHTVGLYAENVVEQIWERGS